MNLLSDFGYPKPGDNIRRKAASLYDAGAFATGVLENVLFQNPALSVYNRNRTLPLSGSEVFFINEIKVFVNLTDTLMCTSPVLLLMREAFLQIFVDEREKIKVPLMEVLNFVTSSRIAEAVPPVVGFGHVQQKQHRTARRLQFPIIINANSNVKAKIVLSAANATAFNAVEFKVYFNGVKYDKLTDFDLDFWQGKELERLSYSVYDVQTIAGTEETLELFSVRNKAETLYNKTLPLSDKESFQIEAIEIFVCKGGSIYNMQQHLTEVNDYFLELSIDDTKLLETTNSNMFSMGYAYQKDVADDGTNSYYINHLEIVKSQYVLPEPIIIPANSKAAVKLRHGALVGGVAASAVIDFKGTLIRKVA